MRYYLARWLRLRRHKREKRRARVVDGASLRMLLSGLKLHLFRPFRQSKMEATLHALSGILLRAIPTFLIVVFLHFYLKYMFFKPLGKVLQARYEATEGARLAAALAAPASH